LAASAVITLLTGVVTGIQKPSITDSFDADDDAYDPTEFIDEDDEF
jgi:hypothetical protein